MRHRGVKKKTFAAAKIDGGAERGARNTFLAPPSRRDKAVATKKMRRSQIEGRGA